MRRVWTLATAGFLAVNTAMAHRLSVEWSVTDGRLLISAHNEGSPAAGADVTVASEQGTVLTNGVLDDAGRFSMLRPTGGGISVAVNAGLGHRRSITLSAGQLQTAGIPNANSLPAGASDAAGTGQTSSAAGGSGDREFSLAVRVAAGLALLLAFAAAWMSFRNSRRLAALERQITTNARRG